MVSGAPSPTGSSPTRVRSLAAGLIATGVAPGDRIGLMAGTSYEWVLCDLAVLTVGAVTVPVYDTSPAAPGSCSATPALPRRSPGTSGCWR